MNPAERTRLKQKILKRNELYNLQNSRLKRILKDPFRTIPYFIISALSYMHPFKVIYKTFWGDKMQFYLPEGGAIYYYGFFEANIMNFFINFLKEGDIFIDIGAHVGFYSLLASKLVGDNGRVHSFEPTPRTFDSLEKNTSVRKNITANNYAVMDSEKTISFADYGPKYSAFNSFKPRSQETMTFLKPTLINVPTLSIDVYCRNKNIHPSIIKIDAEGAEHIILKAMEHVLNTDKPLVTIEVAGGDEWEGNCKKSIEILISKGYEPYEATTNGMLKPHKIKNSYEYDNLVFVHNTKTSYIKNYLDKNEKEV